MTPANLSTVVYDILQAAVTVIWCVSMVILFMDVIIIRYKYHETFTRTRLAPDWVFYLCSALGFCQRRGCLCYLYRPLDISY